MSRSQLLEVTRLRVSLGRTTVLRDTSLSLSPGEALAVTGSNGAGKSTLLRSVIGLVTLTAGEVELDGWSARGRRPAEIARRGVSYMAQGGRVFPRNTVLQNLELATNGVTQSQRRVTEVLDLIPLVSDLRNQIAGSLSGGERQLLALGMTLLRRRRLLLLDEPFAGVELRIKESLVKHIRSIIRAEDLGALIVEHDAIVIEALADRTCTIRNHRLEWAEPHG